jgi:ABC-2 type transport system ATP-binding protein
METIITTFGLTKQYGDFYALRNLSLEVHRGEVFGLLGPNGSGKTTTIRTILGLIKASSGSASVAGLDCWHDSLMVRERVSYLPGELRMFGYLSGYKHLKFLCDLRGGFGYDRAVHIAEKIMELDLKRKVRQYSTGMKQKLALAQAFSDPVEILILDEPTSALDPSAREIVLDLVLNAKSQGQTVIFSGHVLSEVERISDRVAIMRRGQLMHVEDMHTRRCARMVLARFETDAPQDFPDDLGLIVRRRDGRELLFEHQGEIKSLLDWFSRQPISEIAIGTEDLRGLYDRFHSPDVRDEDIVAVVDNAKP